MRIRKLADGDRMRMLEWMHDPAVNRFFRFDPEEVTEDSVLGFIRYARDSVKECHLAIADDADTYMGTVSLKHIDRVNGTAEYAISLHPDAIGRGYARLATQEILSHAFGEYGLSRIYLNVLSDNIRAIKFYEKFGFTYEGEFKAHITLRGEKANLKWFRMLDTEFLNLDKGQKTACPGARYINLNIIEDARGKLAVAESEKEIPFDIKRIFYIYGVSGGEARGVHSNRKTEFVLVCAAGSAKVRLHDGEHETEYVLNTPETGLYIPRNCWKEMYEFSRDCVMLAICSELYDPAEYVRDFNIFIKETRSHV